MTDESMGSPDDPRPTTSGSAPASSPRQSKQIKRVASVLGEPVRASAVFWVEGTLPWLLLGVGLGVGLLRGALGAVIGFAVGYLIARLVNRSRANGVGHVTILAVTHNHVHAIKANIWTNRRTGIQIGEWPRDQVASRIRRKRLTVAVTLELPDGHQVRLESPSYGSAGKWARALTSQMPTQTTGSPIE